MADFASGVQRPSSGCGVQGCLFAAVAVFVILLVGMLVIGFFRFSEPPQGPSRPMSSATAGAGWSLSAIRRDLPNG